MATLSTEANFHVAGTDVLVRGPKDVLETVGHMLAPVSREPSGRGEPLQIDVRSELDVWRVSGAAPKSKKVLSHASALPQVAGATVSSMLTELAHFREVSVWRAAVVERDGNALVLCGDDWESCITLTAHLHTRGWRILGGDYAIVERDTLVVSGFRKLLHANSSCTTSFPLWYRKAIESSPWYSTSHVIAFYAIDPMLVDGASPWGERAPIRALLKVEGHTAEHPSLEIADDFTLNVGMRRADLVRAGVEVAMLVLGGFIETCDFLERWFDSLRPGA